MLEGSTARAAELLLDSAAEAGVPVFFDPNIRERLAPMDAWRTRLTKFLDRIDTLLVGEQELAALGWPEDAGELLDRRLTTVVVKRGSHGADAFTAAGRSHAAARRTQTADPVGAGDAFAAGWISAYLTGHTPQRCLQEANAVASLVVATLTDIAGLPAKSEHDRIIQGGEADVDR